LNSAVLPQFGTPTSATRTVARSGTWRIIYSSTSTSTAAPAPTQREHRGAHTHCDGIAARPDLLDHLHALARHEAELDQAAAHRGVGDIAHCGGVVQADAMDDAVVALAQGGKGDARYRHGGSLVQGWSSSGLPK
jgi:hypothetical protein